MQSGARSLAYNALVMGRDKNKNSRVVVVASPHSVLKGATLNGVQDVTGNGTVSSTVLMDMTDAESRSNDTATSDDAENIRMENKTSTPHTVESNSNITTSQFKEVAVNIGRVDRTDGQSQKTERQPLCRLFKVDLTGQFYRIQAGAVGCGADKIEEWMRTRGSYLAASSRSLRNVPSLLKNDIVERDGVEGDKVMGSDDSNSRKMPDIADISNEEADGHIGVEEERQTDMQTCLSIAHSCLIEIYGPSILANSTVQLATIEGNELWG